MKKLEDGLADFTLDRRVLSLSTLSIAIGVMSAGVAWVLLRLIQLITNLAFFGRLSAATLSPAASHLGAWVIVVPVVGGLVIGFMARFGSEKIRGHGIPEALEAILIGRSKLEPKVTVLKPLSSAVSIGTGGPFGAEGPIIMTGGALGSLIAQAFRMSSAERKTILVAGAAAGMSAVFGTPVAAVLLAVELLLFEWKPRSFIPVAFASASAAAVRGPLLGAGPVFPVVSHPPLSGPILAVTLVVGIVAGLGSGLLTNMVYAAEDLFHKLPLHWMWWPAIGGLIIGVGGYFEPRTLGVGYDVIQGILAGNIVVPALAGILIGKALVWSLALGSGTSGGVLAPLLMMGAALGALEARLIPIGDPGLWALVSMAAMMGGTMRSPFTAIVFALELTHDLNTLPGLLVACIAAQTVTVLWMKRSILTEKVARRGLHLTREYGIDPFETHRIGEIMLTNVRTIDATTTIRELAERRAKAADVFVRHQGAPLTDSEGRLVGVLTQSDLLRALERPDSEEMTALEAGTVDPIVTYSDELVKHAVVKMLQNDVGRLPVVDRLDQSQLVGYIDRSQVMQARLKWYEEEHLQEGRLNLERSVT